MQHHREHEPRVGAPVLHGGIGVDMQVRRIVAVGRHDEFGRRPAPEVGRLAAPDRAAAAEERPRRGTVDAAHVDDVAPARIVPEQGVVAVERAVGEKGVRVEGAPPEAVGGDETVDLLALVLPVVVELDHLVALGGAGRLRRVDQDARVPVVLVLQDDVGVTAEKQAK